MKNYYLCRLLLLNLVTIICFAIISCGGDGDGDELSQSDIPKETQFMPIGVWENGEYFISFNDDQFCCAYFDDKYVDCGKYTINDNIITCNNTYYAKQTKYHITKLTEASIEVNIEYTSISGNFCTKTMKFIKNSNKAPSIKDHSLIGKSYDSYTDYVSWSFETYNTGVKMNKKSSATLEFPLRAYYIFFDGKIYYQTYSMTAQRPTIGGWNPSTTVSISTISFKADGSISNIKKIK